MTKKSKKSKSKKSKSTKKKGSKPYSYIRNKGSMREEMIRVPKSGNKVLARLQKLKTKAIMKNGS